MNLSDVTDEDLVRNGLINPAVRGRVMPFATRDELEERRVEDSAHTARIKQREEADRIYADVDNFVLPPKPWMTGQ